MFNSFRDNSSAVSGTYSQASSQQRGGQAAQQQAQQAAQQQSGANDSFNQNNMNAIHNSLRNLTNYAQFSLQQQTNSQDAIGTTLKEGMKSLSDSVNALTRQLEINNKVMLFAINNQINNNQNNHNATPTNTTALNGFDGTQQQQQQAQQQESEKHANDDFRKLLSNIHNMDNNLLKDTNHLNVNHKQPHNNISRHSSSNNSRTLVSDEMPLTVQQQMNHHSAQQHLIRNRRDLPHRGSSTTSISASLKSNTSAQNNAQDLQMNDMRQSYQHQLQMNNQSAQPQAQALAQSQVPQQVQQQQQQAQAPQAPPAQAQASQPVQQQQQVPQHQQAQPQPQARHISSNNNSISQTHQPTVQKQNSHSANQRSRTSSELSPLDPNSVDEANKRMRKSYKDHEPIYVLTQPSKVSVRDAWDEYAVGLSGNPAVRDLEIRYKTRWRGGSNHTISKQYTNRIPFYKFMEELEAKNRTEFGVKFLEDYCTKSGNKNFRWLQFHMPSEADFRRYAYEHGTSL